MITTTTTNTKKVFSDLANFYVKKNKSIAFIYICAAIIIVCSIVLLLLKDYVQGVIYLCLGVFFALYGLIVRGIVILSNKKNVGTIYTYLFEDDSFNVVVNSKEGKEIANSKINYEALHSVKIYKNYAYIYINKASCYILVKDNFENENQFYSLLKNINSKIKNLNAIQGVIQPFSEDTISKNNSNNKNLEDQKNAEPQKINNKIIEDNETNLNAKETENEENAIIAKIKAKNESDKKAKQ